MWKKIKDMINKVFYPRQELSIKTKKGSKKNDGVC